MAWPLLFNPAQFGNGSGYRQSTATSVVYEGCESLPLKAMELDALSIEEHSAALHWMMLAKEALPNVTSLTSEERGSINEFFWSHFK
ncbi:MAG: hypothetical protein WD688_26120 [Candidatus Binatia bacterium]